MINAFIYLTKNLNDSIDAEKAKKKSGASYNSQIDDMIRAKDTVSYHHDYQFSKQLKNLSKKGKKSKTLEVFVIEEITVEETEFLEKFGPLTALIDMYVIGAWYRTFDDMDGVQHGMMLEDGIAVGVPTFSLGRILVDDPVPMTALQIYIAACNDVEIGGQIVTMADAIANHNHEIPQNLFEQWQKPRDMKIYV